MLVLYKKKHQFLLGYYSLMLFQQPVLIKSIIFLSLYNEHNNNKFSSIKTDIFFFHHDICFKFFHAKQIYLYLFDQLRYPQTE
jgi:hypothetical protein